MLYNFDMEVIDFGVGTGNLTAQFVALGLAVWGIELSATMLAVAREKLFEATLFQADLFPDWPEELNRPFDRMVSAYILHEIDLERKIELLIDAR